VRRLHYALAGLGIQIAGCTTCPRGIESTRERHVVVLPGIFGTRMDNGGTRRFCRQIERELPEVSAQVWDWTLIERTVSVAGVDNLTDYARNRRRAACLAEHIQAWRERHPDTPLYLVGQSGGAGIALFACEALPVEAKVEAVVLVSAGISPTYDVSGALQRTRRGIYNYYSGEDDKLLDEFTTNLGTIDRVYGPAAGYVGFKTDDPRVFQLAWQPAMRELGNAGGHPEGLQRRFAREYLLPLFRADRARVPPEWRSGAIRKGSFHCPSRFLDKALLTTWNERRCKHRLPAHLVSKVIVQDGECTTQCATAL